ncbi:hypothetical protein LCGC14_2934460, partial [marine sediment metagenome]
GWGVYRKMAREQAREQFERNVTAINEEKITEEKMLDYVGKGRERYGLLQKAGRFLEEAKTMSLSSEEKKLCGELTQWHTREEPIHTAMSAFETKLAEADKKLAIDNVELLAQGAEKRLSDAEELIDPDNPTTSTAPSAPHSNLREELRRAYGSRIDKINRKIDRLKRECNRQTSQWGDLNTDCDKAKNSKDPEFISGTLAELKKWQDKLKDKSKLTDRLTKTKEWQQSLERHQTSVRKNIDGLVKGLQAEVDKLSEAVGRMDGPATEERIKAVGEARGELEAWKTDGSVEPALIAAGREIETAKGIVSAWGDRKNQICDILVLVDTLDQRWRREIEVKANDPDKSKKSKAIEAKLKALNGKLDELGKNLSNLGEGQPRK